MHQESCSSSISCGVFLRVHKSEAQLRNRSKRIGGGPHIFEFLKRNGPSKKWVNLEDFFIFALENRGGSCIFQQPYGGGSHKNSLPVI